MPVLNVAKAGSYSFSFVDADGRRISKTVKGRLEITDQEYREAMNDVGSELLKLIKKRFVSVSDATDILDLDSAAYGIKGTVETFEELPDKADEGTVLRVRAKNRLYIFERETPKDDPKWVRFLFIPETYDDLQSGVIDDKSKSHNRSLSAKESHRLLEHKADKQQLDFLAYTPVVRIHNVDLTQEANTEIVIRKFRHDAAPIHLVLILNDEDAVVSQPSVSLIDASGDQMASTELSLTTKGACFSFSEFARYVAEADTLKLKIDTPADAGAYQVIIGLIYLPV